MLCVASIASVASSSGLPRLSFPSFSPALVSYENFSIHKNKNKAKEKQKK